MKKPKEISYRRKSPYVYDVNEEQRILRVQSGGQCECALDWVHGRKGVERCPHKQGERCVEPAKGWVVLTVRFMAKKFDYKKARAVCFSCNMAWDRLIAKHSGRKKKVKVAPEQTGMFE
jgi:hypothetical protein